MENYDIVVVGGGPAGLAAAIEAKKHGVESVLVIERDIEPGGILQQCIHNGFGIHVFKEELTGPEYAQRFIDAAKEKNVEILLDTMVASISGDKEIKAVNSGGAIDIRAKAVILAMGCRERTRGAAAIPGDRPSGVFTAGAAQRYINIEGYMVGRKAVVLGAGDIGMIMARRIVLEGGEVLAVIARGSVVKGLTRNVVQCLEHYNIPLLFNHNITKISGRERVESVTIAQTDENKEVIPGTEKVYGCDTVLLSVGLIPENELSKMAGIKLDGKTGGPVVSGSMETSVPGIFACGNAVHVHDVVDNVTKESGQAGANAARYVKGEALVSYKPVKASVEGGGARAPAPHAGKTLICIVCPVGCRLTVSGDEISGGKCVKGINYARDELTNPVRVVCTTAKIKNGLHPVLPVKTDKPVPERYKLEVVKAVNALELTSPVKMGDVVIRDLFGTGVNVVAERDM